MALTPIGNVRSMLDRALVAFVIGQEAGTAQNTFPANSVNEKSYPVTIIQSTESQHTPKNSGIEVFDTLFRFRASAVNDPHATNPESKRVALDRQVGLVLAAMLQSSDGQGFASTCAAITDAGRALAADSDPTVAANNADMAEFTVLGMDYSGSSGNSVIENGTAWEEVKHFIFTACAKAID